MPVRPQVSVGATTPLLDSAKDAKSSLEQYQRTQDSKSGDPNSNSVLLEDDDGDNGLDGGAVDVNDEEQPAKPLSLLSTLAVVFFLICGGSYGTEDLASLPPLLSLLGLLIIPWVWSFPIAMMTAELATAMPDEESGYLGWLARGIGPVFSFIDAYLTLAIIMFDQTLYPLIFVSYLNVFFEMTYWQSWGICLIFIFVAFCLNVTGAGSVGDSSLAFVIISLVPFMMFTIVGMASENYDPMRWFSMDNPPLVDDGSQESAVDAESAPGSPFMNIGIYFSVLIWASSGYEYSGFLVTQVDKPAKNFPRVLGMSIGMMILTYMLPLSTAIAVVPKDFLITEGAYPVIAMDYLDAGGDWMKWIMAIGGLASNMGTYNSYLHTSSTALATQGAVGVVPRVFAYKLPTCGAKKKYFGSYVLALMFYSITTAFISLLSFEYVVMVEAALYCMHVVMLNCNFIYMRYGRGSELPRPFKVHIPFLGEFGKGNWVAYLAALLPSMVAGIEIAVVGWDVVLVAVCTIVAIAAGYWIKKRFFGGVAYPTLSRPLPAEES